MRFVKPTLLFLAAVALFGLGVLLGGGRNGSDRHVQVLVSNQSGHVADMRLTYRSARSSGHVELGVLEVGEDRSARFFVSGEGSFIVSASEPSGGSHAEAETYVESGYRVRTALLPSGLFKTENVGY